MKVRYRQTSYAVSLLIGDIFMILTALRFSFWLKFDSGLFPSLMGSPNFQGYAQTFGLVVVMMVFFFRIYGLYMEDKIVSFMQELSLVVKAVSVTILLLLGLSFFYRDFSFSRGYIVTAWGNIVCFVFLFRLFQGFLYMSYRQANNKYKEVLMIGANRISATCAIRYLREPRLCTRAVGVLDDCLPKGSIYKRMSVKGKIGDLESVLQASPQINEVMMSAKHLSNDEILKVMGLCEKHLVSFKWFPDMLGLMATQMQIRHEFGHPLLSAKESPLTEWENRLIKRCMDILLSLAALVVLLPVFALIALLVKRGSRGPLFYGQERVGEDGRVFTLFKFRTMVENAEVATGPVWARPDDIRRTRFGKFLRRANLDELPQLWNVIRGDMSLVGPRPERPHFVGQFKEDIPRYMGRHEIKSGITGWAQVNGFRGDTSIEERTQYDLFYVENWSIFLDLKILLKTIFAFRNAY